MKEETRQILIDNILGGHTQYENFASADQFLDSYAIDPEQDTFNLSSKRSSGYLRPTPFIVGAGVTSAGYPLWLVTNPKNALVYVYDSVGSVFTYTVGTTTLTGLKDLNDTASDEPQGARGGGAAYYDNYIYFARATTVARYGPLNGVPAWTTSYWVSTLGKTALVDTTYPSGSGPMFPNHPMKVINGKLIFGDVVGNQGVLHYIKTTKTTVEGDTNDGSTYNAIDFPFGYWPMSIEKYGETAAIALYEGTTTITRKKKAKIIFWDTVNTITYDRTIDDELPDPIIPALYNANGILYVFSGEAGDSTVRILRLTAGYSFEQVAFIQSANVPYAGGVDSLLNRLFFGSTSNAAFASGNTGPRVYSVGLENRPLGNQIFCPFGFSATDSGIMITALKFTTPGGLPDLGFQYNIGSVVTTFIASKWRSQLYRIGQPFKITKIRIPIAPALSATKSLIPTIYLDEDYATAYTQVTINSTNYSSGQRNIVIRPNGLTGWHSFTLDLEWSGTTILTVGLPILIEYEVLPD